MADFRNQPRGRLGRRGGQTSSRNQPKDSGRGRTLIKLFGLFALGGLGWAAWERLSPLDLPMLYPIGYVRVEGQIENLDEAKLQEALKPAINGGYFSQDLGGIEGAVRSFAWVGDVRLSRIWPDTLEIWITEQKAVARWGDKALLNPKGVRFAPEGIEAFGFLPVIYGPSGMEGYLLGMLNKLNDTLGQKGVSVASLDMSKRRAWIVRLSNGLEIIFGRQDPIEGMERFLELVPKLGEHAFARLKRVDLRYSNGFAVVWKSEAEIQGENTPPPQPVGKNNSVVIEN